MLDPLQLLFDNPRGEDAKRWYSQGLNFATSLPDVLVQTKGGPCGVLAALEAHVIMHLQFLGAQNPTNALAEAVWEVLDRAHKAGSNPNELPPQGSSVILCSRSQGATGAFKPDEQLVLERFDQADSGKRRIKELLQSQYSSEAGVMLFVSSLIHSRGFQRIKEDMDDPEALLTGQFGHCGQEMLNLILTGQATSQVHDGIRPIADTGLNLRGLTQRPRVGLLTHLEALRYCEVGSFLKNPEFPVWVVGSESHFTVLYSPDRNCDAKSAEQEVFEKAKRVFTSRDTQENGFVQILDVEGILRELGLVPQTERDLRVIADLAKKCEMPGSEGIVIWTTFWPVIGPILRDQKQLADLPDTAWTCSACTFLNEDLNATACVVCESARPAANSQPQQASGAASTTSQSQKVAWTCNVCTLKNGPDDDNCQACSSSRSTQMQEAQTLRETESGGRTFELVHVDGLEKMVNGQKIPPRKTKLKLTTVDAMLAGPSTSGFGLPFEEVLHTKWPGAVFDYGSGGSAPSITG